jgi:hypothetical protein
MKNYLFIFFRQFSFIDSNQGSSGVSVFSPIGGTTQYYTYQSVNIKFLEFLSFFVNINLRNLSLYKLVENF